MCPARACRVREDGTVDVEGRRVSECLLDERDQFVHAPLMLTHVRKLGSVDRECVALAALEAHVQGRFGESLEFGEVTVQPGDPGLVERECPTDGGVWDACRERFATL